MAIAARVEPVAISEQLERSYIDYAMSVIVGRALPYVQDGLKPVQRRILWAMLEAGLRPDRSHRKCAAVIGDVLKKYHPHGDQAVYDALVRMGQPWNLRVPLIDKQGNFGSIDGDPPAAYRYTEARLSEAAMVLLQDIDRGTVDFTPNFDEEEEEPVLLPARFPNLLVNGAAGIAVGMATNIPPHNLGESIDAVVAYLDDPNISVEGLMEHIQGPDFPTGGFILGTEGIRDAYTTGRGSIRMRARVTVEEGRRGGMQLVATEIPYQVNKATLAKKIQDLADAGRLKEVSAVRDESDRSGIRLVIELRRDANPQVALNKLYKHSQLQDSFGVILLAIVDGVPRTMSLLEIVRHYVEHQVEVITRRTRFDLQKAEERAHIVEGLLIALRNIDEVIRIIRRSEDTAKAREGLMGRFELTEIQANHILEMPLRRLTRLEAGKLEEEGRELAARIEELRAILADPAKVRGVIREEIGDIKEKFADPRRTEIRPGEDEDLSPEQLIADEDAVITLTRAGYVKRLPLTAYRGQKRGGKGAKGVNLKEDDIIEHLFATTTHHWLLFFTNQGRVYRTKVYEIPEASRQARGTFFANLPGLSFERGERIAAVLAVRSFEDPGHLFFATRRGQVKKTPIDDFSTPRAGLIAINLRPGDELMGVTVTSGDDDVLLVTRGAKALKFSEREVRAMGRAAQGVSGMRLAKGDEVIAMGVARPGSDMLCVTENGYGKRTPVEEFTPHHRGTSGIRAIRLTDARGKLAGAMVVEDGDEVFLIASDGVIIRCPVAEVNRMGRDTQGVRLMRVEKTKVTGVARVLGAD